MFQSSAVDHNKPKRLVCFPFAGGGPSAYREWSAAFSNLEVLPVSLPGREQRFREPPLRSMVSLVEAVILELSLLPPKPTVLFGHSLGALMAYETAVRMETQHLNGPRHVIVSGSRVPGSASIMPSSVSTMSDEAFTDAIIALGGTPQEVVDEPELMQLFLPQLRVDFELYEAYQPSGTRLLSCPLTVLFGVDDSLAGEAAVSRWGEFSEHSPTVKAFNGGHFFITTSRGHVFERIRTILQEL